MGTTRNWMWTANLSNSIVGVSVLAMPFCIQQCGLILGLLLLLFSATLTKWSCGLLIRAAQISRRSSYEALALSTFGPLGKNIVEVSIIGLQLGTCIAFYVIIGDLAPPAIARMTGISWSPSTLRSVILCAAAIVIVLPLAMLRDIANLSSISIASLSFYACFLCYLLCLALLNVFGSGKVWSHLTWWNTNGMFKCMPIFSLAFACHTQLLIIYDQHPDPSLSRMNTITSNAINLTASLYALVAIGGYLTFCIDHVEGDILSNFYPSLISQLIKLCFALSVVVSFPMMIFPCRVSINSLITQIPLAPLETPVRIPQSKFIPITIFITFVTLAVAIVLPQIETVLALTGATAGSLISFIYPASIFLSVTRSRDEYRNTAKVIMGIGVLILMVSTVSILVSNMEDTTTTPKSVDYLWPQPKMPDNFPVVKDYKDILPNDADKSEGGAEDKGGGGAGDTHMEQYPDKPIIKAKASEVKHSSPNSPSVQPSDSTQATAGKDDHKELISKLEVLEERVEKLESENQELKKESDKLAQASDNKQDGEKKISEKLVKTEIDTKTVKDDGTVKMMPKSDDSLAHGKDNAPDAIVHKQPSDSLQSDVHIKSKLAQEHGQQQQLTQDETKEDTSKDPVRKQLSKENDLTDKNLKDVEHKEQSKPDVPIPDLVADKKSDNNLAPHKRKVQIPDLLVGKNTDHSLAPQADRQKENNADKDTEKHHDDKILLEKPAVKLNPEIDLNQNAEHKIPNDQGDHPVGQTKRSVDDNLQNLEQNLPKLDTGGDVGVLSRDLLHDSKHGDTKVTTDTSQDKADDTQTTVPSATQNMNVTKNEPKNVLKRDILSLKLTSDNETQSLSNG